MKKLKSLKTRKSNKTELVMLENEVLFNDNQSNDNQGNLELQEYSTYNFNSKAMINKAGIIIEHSDNQSNEVFESKVIIKNENSNIFLNQIKLILVSNV